MPDPESGFLIFAHPGSRIQWSKRQRIRIPEPGSESATLVSFMYAESVGTSDKYTYLYEFRGNPCHSQQQNIAGSSRSCPSRMTSPHTWRRACHIFLFSHQVLWQSVFLRNARLNGRQNFCKCPKLLCCISMSMWESNICNFAVISQTLEYQI